MPGQRSKVKLRKRNENLRAGSDSTLLRIVFLLKLNEKVQGNTKVNAIIKVKLRETMNDLN